MNSKSPKDRIRDYARRLLNGEGSALSSGEPNIPAPVIVLNALRPLMGTLVGVNGFSVLLARALAKSLATALHNAEVRPDGTLDGMTERGIDRRC